MRKGRPRNRSAVHLSGPAKPATPWATACWRKCVGWPTFPQKRRSGEIRSAIGAPSLHSADPAPAFQLRHQGPDNSCSHTALVAVRPWLHSPPDPWSAGDQSARNCGVSGRTLASRGRADGQFVIREATPNGVWASKVTAGAIHAVDRAAPAVNAPGKRSCPPPLLVAQIGRKSLTDDPLPAKMIHTGSPCSLPFWGPMSATGLGPIGFAASYRHCWKKYWRRCCVVAADIVVTPHRPESARRIAEVGPHAGIIGPDGTGWRDRESWVPSAKS